MAIESKVSRREIIRDRLHGLYGNVSGAKAFETLVRLLDQQPISTAADHYDEKTAIAIAYGDHITQGGEMPLATLRNSLWHTYGQSLSHVHVLPCFPYSSDDGFSVIDFTKIDPKIGTWDTVKDLQSDYGLMVDLVLNHVSAESAWFRKFLAGDPTYKDFFIILDPNTDVSKVRRPRTSPLLTPFETSEGIKYVWTTFSADQIDLNYANPNVLLAMTDVLLLYVRNGASFIRLDAITYLWKELGTSCVHLPQTHEIVKLFHDILTEVAPHVRIITETNVPHSENVSYFDNGYSEAHGIYNFALPPLLLHTLQSGDKTKFETWLRDLSTPSDQTFFFNFTSSHDGIGVSPVKEILSEQEITRLIDCVIQAGGLVSYKSTTDNGKEPYEINTTYIDALAAPGQSEAVTRKKFILSQSIMLVMKGIPGLYFGNLFGCRNWQEGVETLGYNRAINRGKLHVGVDFSYDELNDVSTHRGAIYQAYVSMLRARRSSTVFSPVRDMAVLQADSHIIAIERSGDGETVTAYHNISNEVITVPANGRCKDLLTGQLYDEEILLQPYGVVWAHRPGVTMNEKDNI